MEVFDPLWNLVHISYWSAVKRIEVFSNNLTFRFFNKTTVFVRCCESFIKNKWRVITPIIDLINHFGDNPLEKT